MPLFRHQPVDRADGRPDGQAHLPNLQSNPIQAIISFISQKARTLRGTPHTAMDEIVAFLALSSDLKWEHVSELSLSSHTIVPPLEQRRSPGEDCLLIREAYEASMSGRTYRVLHTRELGRQGPVNIYAMGLRVPGAVNFSWLREARLSKAIFELVELLSADPQHAPLPKTPRPVAELPAGFR